MKRETYDVVVVGAGPAGLIASGRVASLGGKVLLLEKMNVAGRKLLITGKGRCNITNVAPRSEFLKHIYPNGRFLKHAFSVFFTGDIIELLSSQGLETIVERGGRVFPISNKSSDVLSALLRWVNSLQVEIEYGQKLDSLVISEGSISGARVLTQGKLKVIKTQKVILCTGGCSYPATGSTGDGYKIAAASGHKIEPPRPALVPLETYGDIAQKLQGLSLKNVNVSIWINDRKFKEAFGEMLFTHFGVSGPIILSLSRFVVDEILQHHRVDLSVDLKPALDEAKLDLRLIRDLNEHGKKKMVNLFRLWLPALLIPIFLKETGINGEKSGHQLSSKERRKVMLLMKNFRLQVKGFRSFKEAIITAGGIPTQEINPETMESKIQKNLYFAGEIIDLDADTGGYNLQMAYSTAWLAGQSAINTMNA